MFHTKKTIWILLFVFLLGACSSSKEQIEGKRISVLATENTALSAKQSSRAIKISEATENDNWKQSNFNAVHLQKNFLTTVEMNPYASLEAGKGASRQTPLLSAPIFADGIVYTQDSKGTVFAFDFQTKERLFKQKLQKSDSENASNGVGLALEGSFLFALNGNGSVFALNSKDGKILWKQDLQIPLRVAPTVGSDILFVQTIDNRLFALDFSDGHEIWSYNISSEDTILAGGAAPAYDHKKEIVVAAFSNGEVTAFNSKIGYPLWSNNLVNTNFSNTALINAIKASPVIDGGVVFAVGNNNRTMAVHLENGDILWTRSIGGTNTPLIVDDALFLLSNNGTLFALDKETGEEIWSEDILSDIDPDKDGIYLSGPLMINSELFITASNGSIYTFNPQNGSKTGSFNIDEDVPFSPITADKKLIFFTNDAELIVYD